MVIQKVINNNVVSAYDGEKQEAQRDPDHGTEK